MQYAIVETAWGAFGYVARGPSLVATYLPRPTSQVRREINAHWPDALESDDLLPQFRRQVTDYFSGRRTDFKITVDLSGVSGFHRAALEQCRKIAYGRTASYQDLARAAGSPSAARAVGSAMANNPLPLVIPCHRVLRSDGSLGGFSSPDGIKAKQRMLRLDHEEVTVQHGPVRDHRLGAAPHDNRITPLLRSGLEYGQQEQSGEEDHSTYHGGSLTQSHASRIRSEAL